MAYRLSNRRILINDDESYRELLKDRGIKQFNQYDTPDLAFPTISEVMELTVIRHAWQVGDKYYKLAHHHYGDSTLWWVIAWYNKKPTEAHIQFGDVVDIPMPLETILSFFKV